MALVVFQFRNCEALAALADLASSEKGAMVVAEIGALPLCVSLLQSSEEANSLLDAIIRETGHSEGRQDLSRQFDTFTSIYIVCFPVGLATQGSVFLLSSCIRLEFPKSYIWQHNTSVDATLNSDRRRSEKEPSACCTAFTRKVKFFDQSQTADTSETELVANVVGFSDRSSG